MSVGRQKTYIYKNNTATCSCENGKYLASVIDNSVITCDEIIDAETIPINIICETKSFYILLTY